MNRRVVLFQHLKYHGLIIPGTNTLIDLGVKLSRDIFATKPLADWYQRIIRIFFDEVHIFKEVTPTSRSEDTEIGWQSCVKAITC